MSVSYYFEHHVENTTQRTSCGILLEHHEMWGRALKSERNRGGEGVITLCEFGRSRCLRLLLKMPWGQARFSGKTARGNAIIGNRPPAKPSVPALGCRSAAERALQRSAC